MASPSVFFLKFMLAGFSVYMLKQVQQYSEYFPPTLLWTCMVFLTSTLHAEKLSADFFPPVYANTLFRYSLGLSVLPVLAWQKHYQIVAFFWMNGDSVNNFSFRNWK